MPPEKTMNDGCVVQKDWSLEKKKKNIYAQRQSLEDTRRRLRRKLELKKLIKEINIDRYK